MKLKSIVKEWFGLGPYPPHGEPQTIWVLALAAHIDAATRGPRSALARCHLLGDGT